MNGEAEPELPAARTPGRGGCAWRMVRLGLVVWFLALLFQEYALPGLLERAIRSRLESNGQRWTLQPDEADLGGFELHNVSAYSTGDAGPPSLFVRRLEVDYENLFSLGAGRIQRVSVSGLEGSLFQEDGGWSLGIPEFEGQGDAGDLRVDRLDIRDSHLRVSIGQRSIPIAFEGHLEGLGSAELAGELFLEVAGSTYTLDFALPAPGETGLVLADLRGGLPWRGRLPSDSQLRSPSLLRVRGSLTGGAPKDLEVEVDAELPAGDVELAGQEAVVDGLRIQGRVALNREWLPRSLGLRIGAVSCAARGMALDNFGTRIELRETPTSWDELLLGAEGRGKFLPGAGQAPLDFDLGGDLALSNRGPSPRVEVGSLRVSIPELRLPTLGALDLAGQVEAEWTASGSLGTASDLRGTLRLHGVRAELFHSDPTRRIRALDPELIVPWTAQEREGSLELALGAPGKVVVGTLQREAAEDPFYAGPFDFALTGNPVLFLPLKEDFVRGAAGAFRLESTAPLRFEGASLRAGLESLALVGDFDASPGPAWTPVLRATLEGGEVEHPGTGLAVRGVALDGPVRVPPGATAPAGWLSVATVGTGTRPLKGFRGSLESADGGLVYGARWQPTPDLGLDLSAVLSPGGDGRVALDSMPSAKVLATDPLGALLEEILGVRMTAEVELRSTFERVRGRSRLDLDLVTRGGRVTSPDDGHAFEGVEIQASYAGPATLAAAVETTLAWSGGRTGELALGPGAARALLDDFPYGMLLGAEARTAGGSRFWSQGLRFGPAAPATTFQIFCEDVGLAEWLDLTTSGRATGEGHLHGRIGLELDPARSPVLRPVEGYLSSDGAGLLRIEDEAAMNAVLERGLGSLELAEGVDLSQLLRDRLVGALEDFAYEHLDLNLIPGAGDLTLQARAQGQGATVPQELDLTVNFNGFGSLLEVLLDLDLVGAK